MAVLVALVSMSVTSCSDDDDDENVSNQKNPADGCSVLVTGSGLGGMFRTQYPVDPSASGKGYP